VGHDDVVIPGAFAERGEGRRAPAARGEGVDLEEIAVRAGSERNEIGRHTDCPKAVTQVRRVDLRAAAVAVGDDVQARGHRRDDPGAPSTSSTTFTDHPAPMLRNSHRSTCP
jgi:hypothetical protein